MKKHLTPILSFIITKKSILNKIRIPFFSVFLCCIVIVGSNQLKAVNYRTSSESTQLNTGNKASNSLHNFLTINQPVQNNWIHIKYENVFLSTLAPDYIITTNRGNLVLTDVVGNSDLLTILPSSGNAVISTSVARTYSLNGGPIMSFPITIHDIASFCDITINLGGGNDQLNIGSFQGLQNFAINGGAGDDEVYFNGDISFASNANLNLDLQNDGTKPGKDRINIAGNVNLILSGTGEVSFRASQMIDINRGCSIVTENGEIIIQGHQVRNFGLVSTIGGIISISTVECISETASLIQNSGAIRAIGALNTGGEVYLVNPNGQIVHEGSIKANQLDKSGKAIGGKVVLQSIHNETKIYGSIDVTGDRGGLVQVLGDQVVLVGAKIDASGIYGGGQILVGGDMRGSNPEVQNARHVKADEGSQLKADAISIGEGGKVIIWADDTNQFAGKIYARGGDDFGNGGFAEVSGRNHLGITGDADLSAMYGNFGTLLLDPGSITIQSGPNTSPPGSLDTFNDGWIANQLSMANVTLSTSASTNGGQETITVNGNVSISWSQNTRLTLQAGRNILINSGAFIENTFNGANFNAIVLEANTAGTASGNFSGISLNGAILRSTGTGNIMLTGVGGNVGIQNSGIALNSSAIYSTGTGTNAASITLHGTGGSGDAASSESYGIFISGPTALVNAVDGNINLTGFSGTGGQGVSIAVRLQLSAKVQATGNGNLNVFGQANALALGLFNMGVATADAGGGFYVHNGNLVIEGQGGGGGSTSFGLFMDAAVAYGSSGSGSITITGIGGSGASDFNIQGGMPIFGGLMATGNITLNLNNVAWNSPPAIQSTGILHIQPRTAGTTIGIAGAVGTLQVNNAFLSGIADGFSEIRIGSATTGNIVANATTFTDNLRLISGGGMDINGALDVGANRLVMLVSGTASQSAALTAGTLRLGGNGNFNLLNGANNVTTIAKDGTGSLAFTDVDNVTVGSVDGVNGVTGSNIEIRANNINATSTSITTIGGAITLTTDGINLSAPGFINSGAGTTTIRTSSAGTQINLGGADAPGVLGLTSTELDLITAGTLVIGRNDIATGTIIVSSAIAPANTTTLILITSTNISGTSSITENNLALRAGTGISLSTEVSSLEAQTATGGISINNVGLLTLGDVTTEIAGVRVTTSGDINIVNTGGIRTSNSFLEGVISQSGNIFVQANGAGANITTRNNSASTRNFDTKSGNLTLDAAQDIILGEAGFAGDILANGNLILNAGRNIIVDYNTYADAVGSGTIVATAGNNISVLRTAFVGSRITTMGGTITMTTGSNGLTTINSGSNPAIQSVGGAITINSDDIVIENAITAESGSVNLRPISSGHMIDLGTDSFGALGLTNAELNLITAGTLIIGRNDIATGTITVSSAIAPINANALEIVTARNILVNANITGGSGGLTLSANQQATPTSASFIGVRIDGATITSTGDGTVDIFGKGGIAGNDNYGILVISGGQIRSGGLGKVTVNGSGGPGSGIFNFGILIEGLSSQITSGGGAVEVNGQGGGGSGSGSQNHGIRLNNGGQITSSGGSVTVTGTGGTGTGNDIYGIFIEAAGQITSGGLGAVTVNGVGGSGSGIFNFGILIEGLSSQITSGGGAVEVNGQGGGGSGSGSQNHGIRLNNGGQITSSGGSVTVTGTGGTGTGNDIYGIFIEAAGQITSGGLGAVTVNGVGGSGSGIFNFGILIEGLSSQITSGGGAVEVNGQGGGGSGSGSQNCGIRLSNGGQITSGVSGSVTVTGIGGTGTGNDIYGIVIATEGQITSGGSGAVTVSGIGGSGSGIFNFGILIEGLSSQITSGGGAVEVNGQGGGGSGSGSQNCGIRLNSGGLITSGGSGSVMVTGTGGTGMGNDNYGVQVIGVNTQITSGGGEVLVRGIGGGTATFFNYGVLVTAGGVISNTGTGALSTVTVVGQGGNSSGASFGNYGVYLDGSNTQITSSGGEVSVTGIGNQISEGIRIQGNAGITSGNNANISINADAIDIISPGFINSGTGMTTIYPHTTATLIKLGEADVLSGSPLTLGLTDAELDQVTAGTLVIGDVNSGNLTISEAISRPVATNIQLRSGGNITFNESFNTNGGALLLAPGNSPAAVKPIFDGIDASVSIVSFASDLEITINGNTRGDGSAMTYSQLSVNGEIDLTGVNLVLLGSYDPLGTDEFVIVDNNDTAAIIGYFNGLIEGSIIEDFLGSGRSAQITYVGGDGNDVVISMVCDISVINVDTSDEVCPDANNGTITVIASCNSCENGSSDLRYSIDNNDFSNTTGVFEDLEPGDYTVYVRDVNFITCVEISGPHTINAGIDLIPPTITCPSTQTLILGDNCTAELPDYTGMSMIGDDCGVLGVVQSPVAGTLVSDAGSMIVTLTVTDINSNVNSCSFTVMKVDNVPPTITCPSTQTLILGDNCTAELPDYTGMSMIGDDCGVLGVVQSPVAGTLVSDAGSMIVTLTVTDINSNVNSCSFTVMKVDNVPPTISCPSTQTLILGGNCTAELPDYTGMAVVGDNCSVLGVIQSPVAGTLVSDAGSMTVTLTVTDINSNVNSCSFTVNKVDNSAPIVDCFNQTVVFYGEASIALNSDEIVDADDNCGIGDIGFSVNVINCSQIGQTIPVAVTVTDVNNNTSTCTSQITVEGLPCGWTQEPNGINCSNGSSIGYNPSNQTWTATSTNCFSGNPFNSDAMAFAQQTLCGNGSITAQVTGISGTALGWAGVSMRENNSGGAKKAQLLTNMTNFSRREFRTVTGGSAIPQQFLSPNRYWLRLARSGNQFSMHVSADGVTWFFAGAQNIVMPSCIETGLVLTNYTSNSTVSATFSNVTVVGSGQSLVTGDPVSMDQHNLRTSEVTIYPNPAQSEAWIEIGDYSGEEVSIQIRDINGRIIYHQGKHQQGASRQRLDLSGMTSGVYMVEIDRANYKKTIERLVVIGTK